MRFLPALVLACSLLACRGESSRTPAVEPGREAPSYSARTLAGDSISLARLRGTPVVLNVWATWCEPCRREIPFLESLYRRHRDRRLEVIGVSVDAPGQKAAVEDFARSLGMSYPIWLDPDGRVNLRFLAMGVPSTYVIDREGILLWKHLGELRETTPGFAEALAQALRD